MLKLPVPTSVSDLRYRNYLDLVASETPTKCRGQDLAPHKIDISQAVISAVFNISSQN